MEWEQVINEKKGKPKKPRKAAQKRKETLKNDYGKKNYDEYEKCVKDLEGKKGYVKKGGGPGTGKYNIYAVCSKALKK